MQQIKANALFIILLVSFVFVGAFLQTGTASAAKAKSDPGQIVIFSDTICPALKDIQNTNLYKYCKSYMYQADMDNAYHKICDVHGAGGTKRLANECNEYKNYVKGTVNPQSGDAADAANASGKDPALEGCKGNNSCDVVGKYVNPAINLLTMTFGLIAVISLIAGGIQYSAAGGDPQNVAKAKKRITDTIIAIVAYFFLYAFLQFLVPGGLFN